MALRSGLAAQIGFKAETTWGTYAVPTRFLEFRDESMSLASERIEGEAIRTANRVQRTGRWAANRKGVGGDVSFEVLSKGFGLIFEHMLGSNTITTPAGGTLARDQTIVIGDLYGKSLTVQVGRPDVTGTVQPFSYTGCKVASWELSNDVDGVLMLTCTFDGKDEDTTQALASASFAAADELFFFTGGVVTIAAGAYDVRNITISGDNGLQTDRYFLRGSSLKKEQIPTGPIEITGSMEAEFDGLTAYNRFVNGTVAALTATWTGSLIEGALNYSVTVTMPNVRFDGDTPNVGGTDILTQPLNFKVLYDGTAAPITIVYRSVDTAA